MITDEIPFILDEAYEENEHVIQFIEDLGKLVKYKYIGRKLKHFLGFKVKDVFLYYNADYLRVVEIHLNIDKVSEMSIKWAYKAYF